MGAVCFAFLWVPASAGMTEGWRGNDGGWRGNDGLFTLTLGPPLNLPLGGKEGGWLEGARCEGWERRALLFSGFPPARE